MLSKKQVKSDELDKVSGGSSNSTSYVFSIFRDGIDEDSDYRYYDSQQIAFDAACEYVQELSRKGADKIFVVKIYLYNHSSGNKELVYEETINLFNYYEKID